MHKTIQVDFGIIEIHNFYVIATINEGVVLTNDLSYEIIQHAVEHFQDAPFVYITNRIHSYSVDPSVYIMTNDIKNLKGFGVVSPHVLARDNATFEKNFLNKEFEIFKTLDEAIEWARNLIFSANL
ncbi:hypothetical protein [Cochleicola gelatinilyticus]|uniref:STAS/SEC14 domain-containing protein n=1 Tax=Cochleicola gelatinilyticus TaxID=1763537 RepID=A0A167HV17_9FLAO|nr:hypothetical protein [Cochleicola gelatinilyticus]OAB78990.1 hypothetical protein ULVI_10480 [Cochleicola gelatinilyticus]